MNTPLVHKALTAVYGEEGDIATLIRTRDAQCPMGHMGDAWDTAAAERQARKDSAALKRHPHHADGGGRADSCGHFNLANPNGG